MKVQNSFAKRASKWSAFVLVPGLIFFVVIFLLHLLILSRNPMSAIAGLCVSGLGTYWFGTSLYIKYKGGAAVRARPPAWATHETAIGLSSAVTVQTLRNAGIGMVLGLIGTAVIADLSPMVFAMSLGIGVVCVLVALQREASEQLPGDIIRTAAAPVDAATESMLVARFRQAAVSRGQPATRP